MSAYGDILETLADDVSFLRVLRGVIVNQPNCYASDLEEMDARIDAKFEALMTEPEASWEICAEAMSFEQVGEIFAAAVLAFRSGDRQKIQQVVDAGVTSEEGVTGLASAMAWLPGQLCHSWVKKFLNSNNIDHTYIAIVVCSMRREDPREYLNTILKREDCIRHEKLYARSIRLVGELKRTDLYAALSAAMQSDHSDVSFWAIWSAVMLGDRSAVNNLRSFVSSDSKHQSKAIELAFRVLPVSTARDWISSLAKDPAQVRSVIKATAFLGDPHAIGWLIGQMRVPALSRLAGEAFASITGMDLQKQGLVMEASSEFANQLPHEDPEDADVQMDEDERLPFPDFDKVTVKWRKCQQNFVPGQRYFMGKNITEEHLMAVYASANQRQRRAAALEMALLQPSQFLLNHATKRLTAK